MSKRIGKDTNPSGETPEAQRAKTNTTIDLPDVPQLPTATQVASHDILAFLQQDRAERQTEFKKLHDNIDGLKARHKSCRLRLPPKRRLERPGFRI